MPENEKARQIRCPECFSKDIDVHLLYDEDKDEYYCYNCCFTGSYEEVQKQIGDFVKRKYVIKRHFK